LREGAPISYQPRSRPQVEAGAAARPPPAPYYKCEGEMVLPLCSQVSPPRAGRCGTNSLGDPPQPRRQASGEQTGTHNPVEALA